MKHAIITKRLRQTLFLPERIQAESFHGKEILPWASGLTVDANHEAARDKLNSRLRNPATGFTGARMPRGEGFAYVPNI